MNAAKNTQRASASGASGSKKACAKVTCEKDTCSKPSLAAKLLESYAKAETTGAVRWTASLPKGGRFERIVLRDQRPVDGNLLTALIPARKGKKFPTIFYVESTPARRGPTAIAGPFDAMTGKFLGKSDAFEPETQSKKHPSDNEDGGTTQPDSQSAKYPSDTEDQGSGGTPPASV
jgi:hypothetical protein